MVSKDELCEQVWPEQFIANATLESAIRLVRKAVGDDGRNQRVIQTVWGYGYRFVADVVEHPDIQEPEPFTDRPQVPRPAPSPFVGRQRELAVLHELLEQVESGRGRLVGLVGGPGTGKSRLLKEFCQSLRVGRAIYLNGTCLFNRTTKPYLPMLNIVRQSCKIMAGDSAETMTIKVYRYWREIGMDLEEGASYILSLLGVETSQKQLAALRPEWIQVRTVIALCRMLLAGSRQRPILIAIEDIHWIDSASEVCIASLAENLANTPILILTTFRPAYQPPWMEKSFATNITMSPLATRDGLSIIHTALAPDDITAGLEQAILAKAAGNPLFLEVLSRLIAVREASGSDTALPDSIEEVLSTRMAQLADGPRRLLQTAAVLGSACSRQLLETIWEGPDDLDTCLSELEYQSCYVPQDDDEEPVYAFTHGLIQDVVYKSLSHARLEALHSAVGQGLEVVYASRLAGVSDLLAHHYLRTEQAEKAIEFLTLLAETAARHWLHPEAIAALQEAMTRVDDLPREQQLRHRLDLALRQAQSLFDMRHWQEAAALLMQRQTPWGRLQDLWLESRYTLLLSCAYCRLEEWEAAEQQAQHALDAATRHGDHTVMGRACYALAEVHYSSGSFREGMALSQLGLSHLMLGLHALFFGDFEHALHASAQARSIGTTVGDPHLPSFADWLAGWAHATCGMWEAAIQMCQRSLEDAPDPLSAALAQGWLGYAYLEQGDPNEAIPLLEQAAQQMRQLQRRRFGALYTTFLGEAYLLRDDPDTARDWIYQGLAIAQETSYRVGIAWAARALGHLDQTTNALAESERHLQEALGVFDAIQARFEVGRTHLDLANLTYLRGNFDVAATHVIEASNRFGMLKVPAYTERAQQCARKLGLPSSA